MRNISTRPLQHSESGGSREFDFDPDELLTAGLSIGVLREQRLSLLRMWDEREEVAVTLMV